MAKRDREINIFNIAFLDVITGAMGAFVLLVILLSPYYTGADPQTLKKQEAAKAAVDQAKHELQQAQQAAKNGANDEEFKKALAKAQADLDEARQELDGLKQQLDQLSAQNKRLTDLDDQQQKELKEAQQRIADLEKRAEQSTKEALDRAEQNMRQADQAIQSGNVEDLRRLLAQARADLAEARKQLDALQQALGATQQALVAEQQKNSTLQAQLNAANATIEDLRKKLEDTQAALVEARHQIEALSAKLQQTTKELAEAKEAARVAALLLQQTQKERDQALAEVQRLRQLLAQMQQSSQGSGDAERWKQQAQALRDLLNASMPIPKRWVIIDAVTDPSCGYGVDFAPQTVTKLSKNVDAQRGLSKEEAVAYLKRGVQDLYVQPFNVLKIAQTIISPEQENAFKANAQFNKDEETGRDRRLFHSQYVLTIPFDDVQVLFGFVAKGAKPTPADCKLTAKFAMGSYFNNTTRVDIDYWRSQSLHVDLQPILFSTIPRTDRSVIVTARPDEVAEWNEHMQPIIQTPSTPSTPSPAPVQSTGAKP
jgi:uncharacterized coiled-coil DUF342 family protein